MRLDSECLREILLCVEDNTGLRKHCFFIDSGLTEAAQWIGTVMEPPTYQQRLLEKYDNDKLIYHLHYCIDAGLILKTENKDKYKIWIADLSISGNELLGKIRDSKNWASVQKGMSAIRSYLLSAVSSLAEGVTSAAISAYLSSGSNP